MMKPRETMIVSHHIDMTNVNDNDNDDKIDGHHFAPLPTLRSI